MERRKTIRKPVKKTARKKATRRTAIKRRSSSLRPPVCIYVDNSNIFIGGQEVAKTRGENGSDLRISFVEFLNLLTEGTGQFAELVWVGSGDEETDAIFAGLRERGADVQTIPRAPGGEHETVDHAIQLSMYRHARKYRQSPGTMILCSGDGKGCEDEKGFLFDLQGFAEDGWHLIVYSWDGVCHHGLKTFAQRHGIYVPLDRYYDNVTFIKGGRASLPFAG